MRHSIALLALIAAAASAELAVPPFNAWVTDPAGALTADERGALETRLDQFTTKAGAQVAVLLVPGTDGEAIESFALRVAEAWQL
ncbi:MAG: TPM domain-containing protein, partial [Gammaproteobacteria bacterium]